MAVVVTVTGQDRLDALTSWRADWSGLRVAVLGLGAAGFAAADTLAELGAEVLVLAAEAKEEYARLVPIIGARLLIDSLRSAPDELGAFAPELIVASPGFAPAHPLLDWATENGVAIWGDIELAWRVRDKVRRPDGTPAEWVLVAGAEVRAETAQLTATLLLAGGQRAAPCGADTVPVLDAVRDPAGFDVLVVALSPAQLWFLRGAAVAGQPIPAASVCLALGAEDDGRSVGTVYRNTRIACFYGKADDRTRALVAEADVVDGARAIGIDLGVPGPSDLGVVEGILVDRAFLAERFRSALELTTVEELRENGLGEPRLVRAALAASGVARAFDVPPALVHEALRRRGDGE